MMFLGYLILSLVVRKHFFLQLDRLDRGVTVFFARFLDVFRFDIDLELPFFSSFFFYMDTTSQTRLTTAIDDRHFD